MAIIGHFTASKDGGWEGAIQTLSINAKIRLVPNDNQSGDKSPAFRLFAGKSEVGAAWTARSHGDNPRNYLSVQFDDPSWPEFATAALFTTEEGKEAQLVWSRRKGWLTR